MTSDDHKVRKGLAFPVVARPCMGHMPGKGEDELEATRVFYVAATRAIQRLVIGVGWDGGEIAVMVCVRLRSQFNSTTCDTKF